MSGVDWSKAPEGATHYCADQHFNGEDFGEHWVKPGFYWSHYTGQWLVDTDRVPEEILIALPPHAWNGQGLPPVGITVRIPYDMACGNDFLKQFEGMIVEVVGHTTNGNGTPLAIFRYKETRYHALCGDNGNFEPIRTPEQIAAEDRERAIRQMEIDSGWRGKGTCVFSGLYDAGYRRTEAK